MSLHVCDTCSTKYALSLFTCPHCQGTSFHEEGQMAKITVHGGASDATVAAPKPEPVTVPGEGSTPVTAPAAVDEVPVEHTSPPGEAESVAADDVPVEHADKTATHAEPSADTGSDTEPSADDETLDGEPDLERPAINAPKADWVDYAKALGVAESVAESSTKRDLVALCDRVAVGDVSATTDGGGLEP